MSKKEVVNIKEHITDFIFDHISFLSSEMMVILISALPVLEIKGGFPIAFGLFEFGFWKSFGLSLLGNTLPLVFLLLLFQPISTLFLRFYWYQKVHAWLNKKAEKRGHNIQKYGAIGLVLFTAIPLPTTGVYSACVAAILFKIRFKSAFISIFIGILLSGFFVGVLSLFTL